MQHLEVSCAVRRLYKSLGFKGLISRLMLQYRPLVSRNGHNRKTTQIIMYCSVR